MSGWGQTRRFRDGMSGLPQAADILKTVGTSHLGHERTSPFAMDRRTSQRASTASSAASGDAFCSLARVVERIYLQAPDVGSLAARPR
jgi:hypothetical protein